MSDDFDVYDDSYLSDDSYGSDDSEWVMGVVGSFEEEIRLLGETMVRKKEEQSWRVRLSKHWKASVSQYWVWKPWLSLYSYWRSLVSSTNPPHRYSSCHSPSPWWYIF